MFERDFERIWDLRLSGDCEAAYEAYLDAVAAGVSSGDREAQRDLRLLKISFLRHRRNFEELDAAVSDFQAWLESPGERPCERSLLQQGLNALARGRLSDALEQFLLARRKAAAAGAAREEQLSYFNALLCMEDLGMEFDSHLREFETGFGPHRAEPWARSIRTQLRALCLRSAFRRSRMPELPVLVSGDLEGEQAEFYAAWLARLPYTGLAERNLETQERFSSGLARRGFGYMSQYRLRTLTMLLVSEDCGDSIRLGEKVERLYLWVWNWLIQPNSDGLGKILKLRSDIELSCKQPLSREEFQLLKAADLWLALFSGRRLAEAEERAMGFAHSSGASCPHLELEERVIRWLALEREVSPFAADQRESLDHDPWLERVPFFAGLVRAGGGERARILAESLASLRERAQGGGVLVELLNSKIRVNGREVEESSSQALVQLLAAFQWKDTESKAELLRSVFGLSSYDSLIHDPKLANLLSRANRLLRGFAQFSTRGEKVHAKIDRGLVRYHGINAHSRCFLELPGFKKELERELRVEWESDRSGEFVSFEKGWWKRSDLESALRLSKASCARWLKEWAPHLDTQGTGRGIRYMGKAGFAARVAEVSVRRLGHV